MISGLLSGYTVYKEQAEVFIGGGWGVASVSVLAPRADRTKTSAFAFAFAGNGSTTVDVGGCVVVRVYGCVRI